MSSRPASWKTPCTSWTWRPGEGRAGGSLAPAPLPMATGAPTKEETELRAVGRGQPTETPQPALMFHRWSDHDGAGHTGWNLVQGLSPLGSERGPPPLSGIRSSRFPRHPLTAGPGTSLLASLSFFPPLENGRHCVCLSGVLG